MNKLYIYFQLLSAKFIQIETSASRDSNTATYCCGSRIQFPTGNKITRDLIPIGKFTKINARLHLIERFDFSNIPRRLYND